MEETSKSDIRLNKGNLYVSATIVITIMAGMFWGGFMMGRVNERLDAIEKQLNDQYFDIKELIKECK